MYYEHLVNALRAYDFDGDGDLMALLDRAADAIEILVNEVAELNDDLTELDGDR